MLNVLSLPNNSYVNRVISSNTNNAIRRTKVKTGSATPVVPLPMAREVVYYPLLAVDPGKEGAPLFCGRTGRTRGYTCRRRLETVLIYCRP